MDIISNRKENNHVDMWDGKAPSKEELLEGNLICGKGPSKGELLEGNLICDISRGDK